MSDLISRESALEILDDLACDYESGKSDNSHSEARGRMINLPSVEPERKAGKWIKHEWGDSENGLLIPDYECDQCHHWDSLPYKYCKNCGAYMSGEQALKYADTDTAFGDLQFTT